ncbi:hypothetical protein F909_04076 [Acinetobacter sp. ANC 3929]|uniref:hypothetical protein n=1 Tax=Acinetobacter sp. ANC 3929 TaxID=1217707 RepID=UPI0002CDC87F|nr:hypothetical protein [Acinetobacter sp. ANC 3929]ENW78387.1 hypothetical protein F909_04076 [Acinetobacter sp. ANC 3929]
MRGNSEIEDEIKKSLELEDFDKYHNLLGERETNKLIETIHKAAREYESNYKMQ